MDSHKSGRRYQMAAGAEAEEEPGSTDGVLRNRLGITSQAAMDLTEHQAHLAAQHRYVRRITKVTRFTAALICKMHSDWLGGIYEWAGRHRTVELAKENMQWPPAFLVRSHMANFEAGLLAQNTPCIGGPIEDVARRVAEVHAELLLIHPFREGNGRLARWLADLMALQAGLPAPEYRFEGPGAESERTRYLRAVRRGYVQE